MSKLREAARNQACLVRLPEICNHDRETTVLAHFRMPGMSGMSYKSPDWLGAFACSACHAYIDSHKDPVTQLDFCLGVFRTISTQIEKGLIKA